MGMKTLFFSLIVISCARHVDTTDNLPRSLCNGCRMRNGKGYNADPNYCYNYIMCHINHAGFGAPERRSCTPGQFWDQNFVTCVPAAQVHCPYDRCLKGISSYEVEGNCRCYWRCDHGRTAGLASCALGYRYFTNSGCLHDPSCTDYCPPRHKTDDTCYYVDDPRDPRKYRISRTGRLTMCCPQGMGFDQHTCGCTKSISRNTTVGCSPSVQIEFMKKIYDSSRGEISVNNYLSKVKTREDDTATDGWVGSFSGNGRLIMPRFTNAYFDSAFKFFIRFKEHPGKYRGPEVLISNADCGAKPSIMLSFDRQSKLVTAMAKFNNQSISLSVKYIEGAWKDVIIMLENGELYMSIDNRDDWAKVLHVQQESVTAMGNVDTSKCALNVGWGEQGVGYKGYIDAFRVYLCVS